MVKFFFHSIKLVKEFNPSLNCAKKVVCKEIFSIWLVPILKDLPNNIKAIHCDKIERGGIKNYYVHETRNYRPVHVLFLCKLGRKKSVGVKSFISNTSI